VTLYEAGDTLGGQLYLAAAPPGRAEFAELARDLATQVGLTDIDVRLNSPADEKVIRETNPDAVILATGARPLTPPIPGVELGHVVQAWDVLNGKVSAGKRVVIVGGGAVGVEVALFLAEKGTLSAEAVKFLLVNKAEDPDTIFELATRGTRDITLLEMIDKIGKDIGKSTRWGMLQELRRVGVQTNIETRVIEITAAGVKVTSEKGESVLPADTVVLAAGSISYNPLEAIVQAAGISCKVVGDAGRVGLAFDAVHQGFQAGCDI
jgi:2,4-dienoyl-CoA reductase (NADPH2)